jgi:outer membrane protein
MRTGGIEVVKRTALLMVMATIGWLAPARTTAQFRLGYVDANVIVQNMPEFKEVESKMKGLRQATEDSLRGMQANLQKELESYKTNVGSMSSDARADAQAKLNALQTQVTGYQNERFGPTGTLAAMQEQLLAPVRQRALEATERVAKDEKLAAVLDLSSFVYVDKKLNVNVTYKVLEYLSTQGGR